MSMRESRKETHQVHILPGIIMLPPAVRDFLGMSSDPDFDDLDGYQANTR